MAILQVVQHRIQATLLLVLIATLAACGGGGGGSKKPDTTPNNFSFTAVTQAAVGAEVTSNAITVSGIDAPASISVSGGQYAIANGAFTSTAGTVTNGQTVMVKVTASTATNTPVSATVNIGGVSGVFTVTTAPDVIPADFVFEAAVNVVPESINTSNTITVRGIDVAVPITITGGEYSINSAAYTALAGTVTAGQTVSVRTTASASVETTTNTTLTIGGVVGTYTVTTQADEAAPTAEFMFPPPVSMTEGTTLLVRGKVVDDYSAVEKAQILVNGGAAQDLDLTPNDDGSASWQMEVTLAVGPNTITVTTEDSAGNMNDDAAQVNVKQDTTLDGFPNAVNPLPRPRVAVIDRLNGRNRLLVGDGNEAAIYAIDLATAERSLVTDFAGLGIVSLTDVLLDENNNQILVRDDDGGIASINLDDPTQINFQSLSSLGGGYAFTFNDTDGLKLMGTNETTGNLLAISLDFTTTEIFSDNSNLDQGNPMPVSRGITFDKANLRYLLTSAVDQTVYAVDSLTGVRSVFSGSGVGGGDDFGAVGTAALRGVTVDEKNQRVIVSEAGSGKIFTIDMETKNRTILSSPTDPSFNPMTGNYGFVIESVDSYAYVCDELNDEIFAVDLVTGHRVYFSKN